MSDIGKRDYRAILQYHIFTTTPHYCRDCSNATFDSFAARRYISNGLPRILVIDRALQLGNMERIMGTPTIRFTMRLYNHTTVTFPTDSATLALTPMYDRHTDQHVTRTVSIVHGFCVPSTSWNCFRALPHCRSY